MTDTDPAAPYGRKKDGTPRKPTGFQKGGSNYAGEPRSTKGDISGPGWGGAAKGAGGPPITTDTTAELNRLRNDPDQQRARAERGELMVRRIEDLALGAEHEPTQLAAAIAASNRHLGAPLQRSVTASTSLESLIRASASDDDVIEGEVIARDDS